MRSKKSFREDLGEIKTDKEGKADYTFNLDKYESASYLVTFTAEGFEQEGGRSVVATNSVLVSPLEYLVGYKKQGNLAYIKKGVDIGVDFIAVNSDLEKVAAEGLVAKIVEFKQISTLVKQSNGTFKYESVKKEYDVSNAPFNITAEGTTYKLDSETPGDFAVVILNKEGLELNRVRYSVAGEANISFELEKNAELQVKLNKSDYNPGEEIELNIRSPYVGAGIITIEKERVYAYKWFKTDKTSSVQTIKLPPDLEGNGYINVSFVRSLDSDEIFMNPLSSSVVPFSIDKSSRINKINLELPELVRPGKTLDIAISTERKGKAIVFAVDEGILQVARYKNPNPLGSFYKKRALEVETRQILDLILPEFSKIEKLRSSQAGGAASLLGSNLNPFKRKREKAVAFWSGVIDVGSEKQIVQYKVPDYFSGRLRVIAVAVSQTAMDAAADQTLVRGHFVLSPNTPNFVAPKDEFQISLGVSNLAEDSGKAAAISINLQTSNNLEVLGEETKQLQIDEGSEDSVTFKVKAKQPLGNASFRFLASHKDKTSSRSATLSIRPSQWFMTSINNGILDPQQKIDIKTPRRTFKQFRSNVVSVSKLPLALASSLKAYLDKYPYGCTEQIVSKGLPNLVLSSFGEFAIAQQKLAEQVQGISEILASRQSPAGGFMQWPGSREFNYFHTAYGVHFLSEANDRGYQIPQSLMNSALLFLKDYSEREPESLVMARVQAYSIYLLTRNGRITTKALTGLEKWLEGFKEPVWKDDIMLLYMAASYKLMKVEEKANIHLQNYNFDSDMRSDFEYGVYDSTIKRTLNLYFAARYFPKYLKKVEGEKLKKIVQDLNRNYNTTSSALAILAFAEYAKRSGSTEAKDILVSTLEKDKEVALKLSGKYFAKGPFAMTSDAVRINNSSKDLAFYAVSQSGFDLEPFKKAKSQKIEVFREFLDEKANIINKTTIGSEVTVRLRIRAIDQNYVPNAVIVDLLPGGFEPVIDSVSRSGQNFNYVDVREDRLLLFSGIGTKIKTYEYKIKAVNKGTFVVPSIFAESMYDRSIQAYGVSGSITVE